MVKNNWALARLGGTPGGPSMSHSAAVAVNSPGRPRQSLRFCVRPQRGDVALSDCRGQKIYHVPRSSWPKVWVVGGGTATRVVKTKGSCSDNRDHASVIDPSGVLGVLKGDRGYWNPGPALPPGIQKNLARGKPLPPGIAKKLDGDLWGGCLTTMGMNGSRREQA
jgi:hypothetical protein